MMKNKNFKFANLKMELKFIKKYNMTKINKISCLVYAIGIFFCCNALALPMREISKNKNPKSNKYLVSLINNYHKKLALQENLIRYSWNGEFNKVKTLLSNKLNIDYASVEGKTAMHFAALNSKDKVIKELVAGGGNVNFQDFVEGNTPLHDAINSRCVHCVKELINFPVDYQLTNFKGETVLQLAERLQDRDIINVIKN